MDGVVRTVDLGRAGYADAYTLQVAHHEEVLSGRESGARELARLLTVEHEPPVITVSRRPGADAHLLASRERLASLGVTVAETDRGGDITYHGPGQLVVYPIVDLNRLNLRLHDYMRLLESCVIEALEGFGVRGERDPAATGVWVRPAETARGGSGGEAVGEAARKICAMGVRVRRWVTLHGLALNVAPNLDHFALIVPCGLHGREVTSLKMELGTQCPSFEAARDAVTSSLMRAIEALAAKADMRREAEA